ncbi:hypothetical protein [Tautonia marina]|uniref:hypothetical protein n=1 Tax=Tautonia marina TaxID=2653855 RepID=UPI00126069E7|nr:hypothetical protein [Tautonia marina]
MPPSLATFHEQRHRRFGRSNPERMHLELWEWIVRERIDPVELRQHYGLDAYPDDGPDWCPGDLGQPRIELPDGRILRVAGEHEDFYDPDFCIYNHVLVQTPDDRIEIYGYPREVFPPTDFHTATLVGDRLILIGNMGYPEDRRPGTTPVFTLDLQTYRIDPVSTHGEAPGWISSHSATLDAQRSGITVSGGRVWVDPEPQGMLKRMVDRLRRVPQSQGILKRSVDEFRLDLTTGLWQRLTDRSDWREFEIEVPERVIVPFEKILFSNLDQTLLPSRMQLTQIPLPEDEHVLSRRFLIEGIAVQTSWELDSVQVLIEGSLPQNTLTQLLNDLRQNLINTSELSSWSVREVR